MKARTFIDPSFVRGVQNFILKEGLELKYDNPIINVHQFMFYCMSSFVVLLPILIAICSCCHWRTMFLGFFTFCYYVILPCCAPVRRKACLGAAETIGHEEFRAGGIPKVMLNMAVSPNMARSLCMHS